MKVLDLQCGSGHVFEGWFGSEFDFVSQSERGLVHCPVCGDATVHKKLSAPRLNLSGAKESVVIQPEPSTVSSSLPASAVASLPSDMQSALHQAWVSLAKQVLANTDDVGDRFAEEARRIHYGEAQERGIRGQTTPEQARELIEEGIDLVAIPIPEHLKKPLQ